METPDNKRNGIIQWIVANQNAAIAILFTLLGIVALIAPGGGGGRSGNGDSEEAEKGEGSGSGGYPDSIRYHFDTVQAKLFDNGDTNWVSYYNADRQRIRYIEKYENGVTRCIWSSKYGNGRQIDENVNYFEDGKESSRTRKVNDQLDGEQIVYHENGNIKLKRFYEMGKDTGIAYFYDADGKPKKPAGQ